MSFVIEYGIPIASGIIGWFVKLLWRGQRNLEKHMEDLKLKLSEEYLKKDDFKATMFDFRQDFKESMADLCNKVNKIDDYIREKH